MVHVIVWCLTSHAGRSFRICDGDRKMSRPQRVKRVTDFNTCRRKNDSFQALQVEVDVPSDSDDGKTFDILQVTMSNHHDRSMTRLLSPAKTNIFLRITKKRDDGFHELASVFQALSLGDTLKVSVLEVPVMPTSTSEVDLG